MTSISLATLAALARQAAEDGYPMPCSRNARLWFSERPADLELAKASCRTCPLRLPCLAGAVERAEPWGVWGGEIFENGVIIAFKRPRGHPGRRARAS
jgi:WhiB family transcriptional regulator, redox-sensing transcriptional regulator